ncbi:MAG TPA: heme exporter protein CcmD [Rhizomicrobium sp.]|jgi:heme exporter protein CcmD
MSGFFTLDQYAPFVWAAYGVSALGIAGAIIFCWQGYARAKVRLAALEKTAP